jgi:hypothetical protein
MKQFSISPGGLAREADPDVGRVAAAVHAEAQVQEALQGGVDRIAPSCKLFVHVPFQPGASSNWSPRLVGPFTRAAANTSAQGAAACVACLLWLLCTAVDHGYPKEANHSYKWATSISTLTMIPDRDSDQVSVSGNPLTWTLQCVARLCTCPQLPEGFAMLVCTAQGLAAGSDRT